MKASDIFNLKELHENHLRVDPAGVNPNYDDGVAPHEAACTCIHFHDQLVEAIKDLVTIIEINSKFTNNDFAWAEVESAKRTLEELKDYL